MASKRGCLDQESQNQNMVTGSGGQTSWLMSTASSVFTDVESIRHSDAPYPTSELIAYHQEKPLPPIRDSSMTTDSSVSSDYTKVLDAYVTEKLHDQDDTPETVTSPTASESIDPQWETDPDNAMNWGFWKKFYNCSVPALMCLASTFGSSVYVPAAEDVQRYFGVSTTVALLPLSVYIWGLAFGPIIGAPISETYGRRYVYLITMPLFLAFIMGAGLAQNMTTLVVCRFLAGVMGSPPLAVGAGTNLDIWPAIIRARTVAVYSFTPFLGPALGPSVGGFVASYADWRWTQWTILFLGGGIFLFALASKETYAKIILKNRAQKLGLPAPPDSTPSGLPALKLLVTVTITRPIHMLFTEPIVMLYSCYSAFNFAVLYCFFASFPVIFNEVYHFTIWQTGLVFFGLSIGTLVGAIISILVDQITYVKRLRQANNPKGHLPPEERLYSAMIGSFMLPIGLFWFAWSAEESVHWICPAIATVLFACGSLLVFVASALYLTDVYGPKNGSSALAANGLARYALGGSFPLFTLQMYSKLGIDWATTLLAFISLALLPVPWVFFKYGAQIRKKSNYDVIQF